MTKLLQLCSLSVSSLIPHHLPLAMSYSLPMVQSSLKNAENLERNWTTPKPLAVLRNDDTRHIVSWKNRYFKLPAVTTSQGWEDTWGPLRCQAQQGTNTEVRRKWHLKEQALPSSVVPITLDFCLPWDAKFLWNYTNLNLRKQSKTKALTYFY